VLAIVLVTGVYSTTVLAVVPVPVVTFLPSIVSTSPPLVVYIPKVTGPSTIGLGAWSKGGKSTDALSLSTKVGPVTLGIYTTNGGEVDTIEGKNVTTGTGTTAKTVVEYTPVTKTIASTTHVSVAADIAGAKVKIINNPKAKWTNLSAKGTFGGILVAAEHHKQKAVGTNVEQKVTLLHVGGKVGAVKWDVAQYKNKDAAADLKP
jgi:hypothetical protein